MSFKKLRILFFFFLILFCSNTKPFEKLQTPKKDFGLLYLLRSYNSTLSLYSLEIEIWKYTGHFKSSSKKLFKKFSLNTGEFVLFNLEEGFYEIFIKDDNFSHIFYVEKDQTIFKNITIISKNFFSISEFYIETINRERAVDYLLEGTKMKEKIIQ